MAGVPFDTIQRLDTPDTIAVARELLARTNERADAIEQVETFFRSREQLLSAEAYHALRIAVRLGRPPTQVSGKQPSLFTNYAAAAAKVASLESTLNAVLEREIRIARSALLASSRTQLVRYLVFGAESVRGLLVEQLSRYPDDLTTLPGRNNAARKIEQSLLLYLQRLAAKNDTFANLVRLAGARSIN